MEMTVRIELRSEDEWELVRQTGSEVPHQQAGGTEGLGWKAEW